MSNPYGRIPVGPLPSIPNTRKRGRDDGFETVKRAKRMIPQNIIRRKDKRGRDMFYTQVVNAKGAMILKRIPNPGRARKAPSSKAARWYGEGKGIRSRFATHRDKAAAYYKKKYGNDWSDHMQRDQKRTSKKVYYTVSSYQPGGGDFVGSTI